MKRIILILFVVLNLLSFGQERNNTESKINKNDLKQFIRVLTSDSLEGRETGTVGQGKAAKYISNRFNSLGLLPYDKNGYFESFELQTSRWGEVYMKSGTSILNNFVDMIYYGSEFENEEMEKVVVFGGNGTDEQLKQINVNGKIVLLFVKNLRAGYDLSKKLKKLNAYGLILANPENDKQFESIRNSQKEHSLRKIYSFTTIDTSVKKYYNLDSIKLLKTALVPNNKIKTIIRTSVSKLNKAIATNEISKIPSTLVKVKYERIVKTVKTTNVCGLLKGKTDKYIIISAHYDHLGITGNTFFPGADDNASGTAALMELAEELSNDNNLNYNIVFLATTGEEEGLFGSKYFLKYSTFDSEKFICNLNMDMISRSDSMHSFNQEYLYCIGTGSSEKLKQIIHDAEKQYKKCSFDYSLDNISDPFGLYSRSDQSVFYHKGIPSICFFSGLHEDYHKITDTEGKINYSVLEERIRLIETVIKLLQSGKF